MNDLSKVFMVRSRLKIVLQMKPSADKTSSDSKITLLEGNEIITNPATLLKILLRCIKIIPGLIKKDISKNKFFCNLFESNMDCMIMFH